MTDLLLLLRGGGVLLPRPHVHYAIITDEYHSALVFVSVCVCIAQQLCVRVGSVMTEHLLGY